MINWNEVEEDLSKIINRVFIKLTIDYIKSLIAKEFKLVASGGVTRECGDLDIFFIDKKQINMMFKKYDGKNIEIYIREVK
jgi:hypothetical protein